MVQHNNKNNPLAYTILGHNGVVSFLAAHYPKALDPTKINQFLSSKKGTQCFSAAQKSELTSDELAHYADLLKCIVDQNPSVFEEMLAQLIQLLKAGKVSQAIQIAQTITTTAASKTISPKA